MVHSSHPVNRNVRWTSRLVLNACLKPSSFHTYLRRRGYDVPWRTPNALYRWFVLSFGQPGFASFWRLWNPVFGYYLLKLYRRFGGDRRRVSACVATFCICGFLHDLFAFVVLREPFTLKVSIAFLLFALIVLATSSRSTCRIMRQIPSQIHVLINFGWIAVGFIGAHFIWAGISDMIPQ